jgi:UTP--glucose-1-phosphate uridylyltransferase
MKTAVITTGGLGTRLLTCTKSNPKTMLPLYCRSFDKNPEPLLRPLIEIIFENLYNHGFRRFCFIVGTKTKRSIQDHMVPDMDFIKLLKKRNNQYDNRFVKALTKFYNKIDKCEVSWISQNTPMGFGHALLSAKKFVGKNTFLLHAGDTYFPSYDFLDDFIDAYQKDNNISGTLLLQAKKSLKGFGIAQTIKNNPLDLVFHVAEKPKKPLSNLVILPVYILKPIIFEALEKTGLGHNKELQVTDAIATLMRWNHKITAFNLRNKPWFDIGTTRQYYNALSYSYKQSVK